MILPFALLAGLLVVAINCELLPALPGAGTATALLATGPLLLVPAVLAWISLAAIRRELVHGRAGLVPARALLRLSAMATPIAVHALYAFGAYGDWVDWLAWDSHLGRIVLSTLPVFLAELPRLVTSTLAATACEIRQELGTGRVIDRHLLPRAHDIVGFVRMKVGGFLLVAMPLLLLGAALDLLQQNRELYVFVLATSPGVTLGAFAFLAIAVVVLPFWFRIAFAVQPLPEPPGNALRATAQALGFAPHRLYLLPTGMRALNAMLVGPLPVGRCLCLTDGLVRELDADSLAGVVAHEVGHAKMGHPALLIALVVVVPLALLVPLRLVNIESVGMEVQALFAVASVVGALWLVRTIAHRFEHEADVASVRALGSGPCSRALMVVSRLATPVPRGWFGRTFTLHPDEASRWQVMRRYENEPTFRATFEARGRRLRRAIGGVLVLALGVGAWASSEDWPYEQVVWRLHSGDHKEALQAFDALGAVPARWSDAWKGLQEELTVVQALAPMTVEWSAAQAALGHTAEARGQDVLLAAGPAAARPWFSMALGASSEPSELLRAMHAYCEAAADGDAVRMEAIRAIVSRIGVPTKLAAVFAP